jgi:cell division protein FtsX
MERYMDKKQKCALKHAVVDTAKMFGFLIGMVIGVFGAAVLLTLGAVYVLDYLVAMYPILSQPIHIPDEYVLYMAIIIIVIFIGSIIYGDIDMRYKKYLKRKECNDEKED